MTPAETAILDLIDGRLQSITTANGYSMDIRKIKRAQLTPFKPGDIPAINYWPVRHSRSNDEEYGSDVHSLRVIVDVRDSTRDKNFADVAGAMIADVITALNRSVSEPKVSDPLNECLGDTVTDLTMEDSAHQIGEGQTPWLGAVIELEVIYKSPVGDMFTFTS